MKIKCNLASWGDPETMEGVREQVKSKDRVGEEVGHRKTGIASQVVTNTPV